MPPRDQLVSSHEEVQQEEDGQAEQRKVQQVVALALPQSLVYASHALIQRHLCLLHVL